MFLRTNSKIKVFLFLVFVFSVLFFIFNSVNAQPQMNAGMENLSNITGLKATPLPVVVGRIVRIVLGFLGLIAVIIIIYAGFVWMTSGGNPDKIAKAKKIITAGVIGLAIIVLSYAIVSFILHKFGGIGGGGEEQCTPGSISGCYRCSLEGRWVYDSTISGCALSPDAFSVKKIVTSHGGSPEQYHQDVYLCSVVMPVFNHWVDKDVIAQLVQDNKLKIIEENGTSTIGTWEVRNNTIVFKHPDLFSENTDYQLILPKAIKDKDGRNLFAVFASGCSKSGCSFENGHFIWPFKTGETIDDIPPEVVSTYPVSEGDSYPDRNVSRKPLIQVNFSEAIDPTTITDDNNNLLSNVWIAEITEQNGEIVQKIPLENISVEINEKGFNLSFKNNFLLKPFTWYRIHVEGVKDLCNNEMEGYKEWEFETNDRAPGIESWYPKGDNVCPDTKISITFTTQMFENTVNFYGCKGTSCSSDSENLVFKAEIKPEESLSVDGVGGTFKVLDSGEPVSNHYRTFEFSPTNNLDSDTDYTIKITTDLPIDITGNTLSKTWTFHVTNPETCVCSPYISFLDPNSGKRGECLTINGYCFKGTDANPATLDSNVYFTIENSTSTTAEIYGSANNYVTTVVPNIFNKGDRPNVSIKISYDQINWIESNKVEFYVNSTSTAYGPCLLKINPDSGYPNEAKVDLEGVRFGSENGQVIFFQNKSTSYESWSETKIEDALVPNGAKTGLVVVKNVSGISNGLPFEVLRHYSGPGESCYDEITCPNNTNSCQDDYHCLVNENCLCCCSPGDKNQAGLSCYPNQYPCTGENRGLYCGCQDDSQCGSNNGCGFLDPNKCCYPQPKVKFGSACLGNDNKVGQNASFKISFDQLMDHSSLNSDNIYLENASSTKINGKLVITDKYNTVSNTTTTQVIFYPSNCRLDSGIYKFYVKGGSNGEGVRSIKGVSMPGIRSETYNIGKGFCDINSVKVEPQEKTIHIGERQIFSAEALDENDNSICVDSFSWSSSDSSVATVDPTTGLETTAEGLGIGTSQISATAQDKTGSGTLTVIPSPLKVVETSECDPENLKYPSPFEPPLT